MTHKEKRLFQIEYGYDYGCTGKGAAAVYDADAAFGRFSADVQHDGQRGCGTLCGRGGFGRSGRSLANLLGVATATYDRRVREGKPLSHDDSDRVARLIEVERAATRVFGDEEAAREWLAAPVPALGGAIPIELLATTPGYQAVTNALRRIMSGSVA